jgi:hypothetical protein
MTAVAREPAPATGRVDLAGLRSVAPSALLALLIAILALQRGGYFAESWGLPAAACAWAVTLAALLGDRQRLRRLELIQLAALALLGVLALLSSFWQAGGVGSALPQAQLLALYLSALSAVYMLFRRATPLLVSIWLALSFVSTLAVITRLFPTHVGSDTMAGNRLSEPLGYWNSLGLWAAMALLLALVLAGRARSTALRIAASASCVPASASLYFTFSRGAWIALVAGLIVAVALDSRRLGLVAWIFLAAPWPALTVFLASQSSGLTSNDPTLGHARHDGRRLAVELIALVVAAGCAAYAGARVGRRWRAPRRVRRAFAYVLAAACVLGVVGIVLEFGSPPSIARKAAHGFTSAPPATTDNLNGRLFAASGSGRIYLWRVAWHDARDHPVLGSGAGSYAGKWFRERTVASEATNAHQLYLETLAELGPFGLACLLVALGTPLVAAWRARRHPLAAGAAGAYVAFLVHAAADWDWQLAAVGLAALCCGSSLLVMARVSRSQPIGAPGRIALVVYGGLLAGFALWSLYGSLPQGQARDALDEGRWAAAEAHAETAVARVGGFSGPAWQLLGEAQTALGRRSSARLSLRTAVARDPSSWESWYDLALVSQGAERRHAAGRALMLNPLDPEVSDLARLTAVARSVP